MKTSILVPVGAVGVFVAAVVLASPMTTETVATPAMAPNRAEVHVVVTCIEPVTAAGNWHDALASKRALDRNLVLASATTGIAEGCDTAGQ